jgi:hypothetical protein
VKSYSLKRILGLFVFCFFFLVKATVFASVGGILIPFYIYPTPDAIQPLLNAKIAHPNVPMRVILDPANGPGTSPDPNYVSAIASLRLAGIQIAGYVYTNYDSRSITDVMTDISTWQSFYNPDGIFLDSMGTDGTYYQTLTNYIHNLGMTFSIGNAGGPVSTVYTSYVDTVVIGNADYLPNISSTYQYWINSSIPPTETSLILYNITDFPSGFIYEAKMFVGWLYITDAGGMDPYGVLPSYFSVLMNSLDTLNTGTIFPFYIYPTPDALQPLLNIAGQYPNVPIWVILDPDNGPGTFIDPTYTNAVATLRAAGITMLGYVNTNLDQFLWTRWYFL